MLTVIRWVLAMGTGNASGGSTPSFGSVLKELLEEYIDEVLLNDRLRAQQSAKHHA